MSPKIEINLGVQADKAAHEITYPVSSTYTWSVQKETELVK
jgi:hypothetical protein